MTKPLPRQVKPAHLLPALIACGLVAIGLAAGWSIANGLEKRTLRSTAWRLLPLKTQGLSLQRTAARSKTVLPLYGSSELLNPWASRASDFFRTAPTGFQVSPVGNSGATSLTILQRIGALGPDLRGKKVAISISPGWFLLKDPNVEWYKGNFSSEAASALIFGDSLDLRLKREIASRLLLFPQTLENTPLLEFALERLVADRWCDRAIFRVLLPLGKAENVVFELQDHFEAIASLWKTKQSAPPPLRKNFDWDKLRAQIDLHKIAVQKNDRKQLGDDDPLMRRRRDARFVRMMASAPEWVDLELLLCVLEQTHARPLLLSMPLDGHSYDESGVSFATREMYYRKIRAIAQHHHFPLVEFENDDEDRYFLDRQHVHLTAEGWTYYNHVLDDFFHDRTPRT